MNSGTAHTIADREICQPSTSIGTLSPACGLFMTLLIQRTEHSDTQAIHARLDELLEPGLIGRSGLAHCLKAAPRVKRPPWNLETTGVAHVSAEASTALPASSALTPSAEIVARAGPLSIRIRCIR